jgi:hypothetical protein
MCGFDGFRSSSWIRKLIALALAALIVFAELRWHDHLLVILAIPPTVIGILLLARERPRRCCAVRRRSAG